MAYLNTQTAPFTSLTARIARGLSTLMTRYRQYRMYRETFEGLSALTNRELADLGLNRSELRYVARKSAQRG